MLATISVWEERNFDEFFASIDVPELEGIVFEGCWEFVYDRLNAGEQSHQAFARLVEIATRRNVPLHIVTGGIKDNAPLLDFNDPAFKNIKMYYWDTFWFTYAYYELMQERNRKHNNTTLSQDILDFNINDEFKFPFITMNCNPKTHRIMLMDQLAKHNLIDKGAIAWRDMHNSLHSIRHTFPEGVTDSMYMGMVFEHWTPKRMFLDQEYPSLNPYQLPTQYKESFIQVSAESFETEILFSEKTAVPLFLAKPFLLLGTKGYNHRLTDLGFVLYDELFDYSFDNLDNLADRVEGVIQNVLKIVSFDTATQKQKLESIKDKLIHNKRLAHSIATDMSRFPKPIMDLQDYRDKTGTGGETVMHQLINFIKYANL